MQELLSVHALERRFGSRLVLRGLDFRLLQGEVLGLLGRNGAGKTTCLRILSGTLAPSNGMLRIRGFDLANDSAVVRRHIGYLPETPPLYPEMRVDEYLRFCARLRRVPPANVERIVRRIKQRCGLDQVGRRLLCKLSKGYRQRAGLAQALIHEPDLVLLDEPTDGLDPVQIHEVRALIHELAPSCGIILSSHALSEIQAICNRVLILSNGQILHETTIGMDNGGTNMRVRLRNPPPTARLEALAMVVRATPIDIPPAVVAAPTTTPGDNPTDFRIELSLDAGADQLAHALVQGGWGLLEMTPEQGDLERIFFHSIEAQDSSRDSVSAEAAA